MAGHWLGTPPSWDLTRETAMATTAEELVALVPRLVAFGGGKHVPAFLLHVWLRQWCDFVHEPIPPVWPGADTAD